jgi:phage repressor protein C with HTH and peptisase S24 domain
MDTLGARVKFRREQLGWSQHDLAAKVGIKYQSVQAVEKGGNTKYLLAFARALGVRHEWLERAEGEMLSGNAMTEVTKDGTVTENLTEAQLIGATPSRDLGDMIPVRAAKAGADMVMFVEDDPIDYRPRPPILKGVQGAYSMWITGNSMSPVVKPGQVLHVDPNVRAAPGDLVIVWKTNNAVIVKELVRRTQAEVHLSEWTEREDGSYARKSFVIPARETIAVHKVVGVDLK